MKITLHSNYPNPFNPGTMLSFSIGKTSKVKLDIFDINGRNISSLVNKNLSRGSHQYYWDASKKSSGVYFVSLMIDGINKTQKIMLMK